MKLFLGSANIEHIKELNEMGIISGITINPSLLSKEGEGHLERIKNIIEIFDGLINVEGVELELDKMVEEAIKLSELSKNIVGKILMCKVGLNAVKILTKENVRTNVTVVYTPNQAILAAQVGADYVSFFVGRSDDASISGLKVLEEATKIYKNYNISTKVIAASMRTPYYVTGAALAGADIATIPYSTFNVMFKHAMSEDSLRGFLSDWKNNMGNKKMFD